MLRCAALLLMAIAASAQTPPDPATALARTRDRLLERVRRIPNYICVETTNRSYFRPQHAQHPTPSCREILDENQKGNRKLDLQATDRVRLEMKVSDDKEIASWVGADRFSSGDVGDMIGGGPFGTGPLGTLIGDIFDNPGVVFEYVGPSEIAGIRGYQYRYRVPRESSHHLIRAGDHWVASEFSGLFWLDPEKYELRRITVVTAILPPETEACREASTTDYQPMRITTGEFLAPEQSVLRFVMRNGMETENATAFASCHEYQAESKLNFSEPPEGAGNAEKTAPAATPIIPAGFSLTIALDEPIDTAIAAAGDAFNGIVRKPVRDRRRVYIPKGAVVHGRITEVEHWLNPGPHRFRIDMILESVEIGGVQTPIYAVPSPDYRPGMMASPPPGRPLREGSFLFLTDLDRFVMKRGTESTWLIVPAPQGDPGRVLIGR